MHSMSWLCNVHNSTNSLAKLLSLLSPISFCYLIYNPLLFPVYLQKTKRRLLEYRKRMLLPKHIYVSIILIHWSICCNILYMAAHWNWTNHSVGCSTILFYSIGKVSSGLKHGLKVFQNTVWKHSTSCHSYGIHGNLSTCGEENKM